MNIEVVKPGALSHLKGHLGRLGGRRVLLVHGLSFEQSETRKQIYSALEGVEWTSYRSPPAVYLDLEIALECASLGHREQVGMVVAIGGGRIIDLAKLATFAIPGNNIADFLAGNDPPYEPLPLIALPSTAGSGSQATHFAVFFKGGDKYSLAHPGLLPSVALVDSLLIQSCDQHTLASSGLDALCQGIESLWSCRSTEESRRNALRAIELAWRHLKGAVCDRRDSDLEGLTLASHLAGKAINISFTTAAHALSYVLTSHFGVSHGHAVALLLGPLLQFNSEVSDKDCNDPRGVKFVRARIRETAIASGCPDARSTVAKLDRMMSDLGLSPSLVELGAPVPHVIDLARERINAQRLANNPRRLDWNDIESLYLLSGERKATGDGNS